MNEFTESISLTSITLMCLVQSMQIAKLTLSRKDSSS